jgi:hypothetical protein
MFKTGLSLNNQIMFHKEIKVILNGADDFILTSNLIGFL